MIKNWFVKHAYASTCLLLLACCFLLYGNTLNHRFAVDDFPALKENKLVQKGFSGIPEIFIRSFYYGYDARKLSGEYRPVTSALFAIEVGLFGKNNPGVHHLFQALFFALLCMVLFRVLQLLSGQYLLALGAVLLFLVHPVHTEVVANIKSRDELLAFLFFSLSWLSWIHYLQRPAPRYLLLVALCYLVAVFSKETAVPLVLIFPLTAWYLGKTPSLWSKPLLAPLLVLAGYLAVRYAVLEQNLPEVSVVNNALAYAGSWSVRTASALYYLGKYLLLLFFPYPLSWDYSFHQLPLTDFANGWVLVSVLVHLALVFAMIRYWRSQPFIVFFIAFYFISIGLYSQLLFLLEATFAERFLFVPSLAFCVLLCNGIWWVYRKNAFAGKGIAFTLLVAGSGLTIARNADWKNNFTLYTADIVKVPNSIRANSALGFTLYEKGQKANDAVSQKELYTQAAAYFTRAINIYGSDATTWFNYGMVNLGMGEYTMAELAFKETIRLRPDHTSAYNNLGNIQYLKKELGPAKYYYRKAVASDDKNAEAWNNLGAIYLATNVNDSALLVLEKATALEPANADARNNLRIARKRLQH